jgi:predicted phosphoribosyltransferase
MTAPKPPAAGPPAAKAPPPLYPTRSGAGAFLGRQLGQRILKPVLLLGITPSGVEIAAAAAQAMGCDFDVVVASHVRMEGLGIIGAIAEDSPAVTDSEFQPRFGMMEALEEAMDRARRAIKTERILFRGQRPLHGLSDTNVVIMDGNLTSPWKALAAAEAATQAGAMTVAVAAAASTSVVQEHLRNRRITLICPAIVMDHTGHPNPFGDPTDASAERLRSIVVARQAA